MKPSMPEKEILLILLFLTAATLLAFGQVNHCDFISYDDGVYLTANHHIQNGLSIEGIRWAFTTDYANFWHPLTWLSHMLDVQLFGLNPRGHHLTNLLFHIVNTLLLFFVLHQMTNTLWQSAFVAALFALHPLHVESVAWVAERKDVLSTFFWILLGVSEAAQPGGHGVSRRRGDQGECEGIRGEYGAVPQVPGCPQDNRDRQ
jgi:protein O-mannosyl-transferase